MKTVSIIVKGKVQGVFYRQSTRDIAKQLGLTGKVKNLNNGDVQVIVSGTEDKIHEMIKWCRLGPPAARVTGVETKELPSQDFNDFRVERH